jgi:hypothetical protein
MAPAPEVFETVTASAVEAASDEAAIQGAVDHDAIAALAYEYWLQRGCPIGSPEEDWFRAEKEIRNRQMFAPAATAA